MKFAFLFYFILGTAIGSFLPACCSKPPQGKSLQSPFCCDSCGHLLNVRDMVPLVSFILLRGRCRYCGAVISCRLPELEMLTGCLFLLAGTFISSGPALYLIWCFLTCLAWETVTDLRDMIIPDESVLLLLVTGSLWRWLYRLSMQEALYGILTGLCFLELIRFLSRGGMGLGDVKLAGALGVWLGGSGMAVCLILAFLAGGMAGLILWLGKRVERGSQIPFGPFLALGAVFSFFYGPAIQSWYWSLFL